MQRLGISYKMIRVKFPPWKPRSPKVTFCGLTFSSECLLPNDLQHFSRQFNSWSTFSSPTWERQNLLYSWIHVKQTPGGDILAHVIKDLIEVKQDNHASIDLNQIVNYVKYKTTKYKVKNTRQSWEHKAEWHKERRELNS